MKTKIGTEVAHVTLDSDSHRAALVGSIGRLTYDIELLTCMTYIVSPLGGLGAYCGGLPLTACSR